MGNVSTCVQIDVTNLTAGADSPEDILTNPLCFGVAFANTLTTSLSIVDTVVQELLLPVQNLLDCKTIPSINKSVLEACPGYSLYRGRRWMLQNLQGQWHRTHQ